MLTRKFWLDTAERCMGTFFAALLVTLGSGTTGLTSMPWLVAIDLAAGAAALTLFKCLVASGIGPSDSASVLREVGSGK